MTFYHLDRLAALTEVLSRWCFLVGGLQRRSCRQWRLKVGSSIVGPCNHVLRRKFAVQFAPDRHFEGFWGASWLWTGVGEESLQPSSLRNGAWGQNWRSSCPWNGGSGRIWRSSWLWNGGLGRLWTSSSRKKAIRRKSSFYLEKTMVFEGLGDPESSIVALRWLQRLRRNAVRRRFCRAWRSGAPLASRDAEAWATLDAETGFPIFGVPRRSQDPCRTFCIDIYYLQSY